MIRVVLADDHDLVRAGIKALLHSIPGVEVIAEAREGHELLSILDSLAPDVVMTDISMPGLDGLAATALMAERFPRVKVIVISMHADLEYVRRAVAQGASGYLRKDARPCELEQALRSVIDGGSYFSAELAQRMLAGAERAVEDELTFRQIQVLKLLAEGRSPKEAAFELGLSAKTVLAHRASIMARLNLNDTASLTRYAVRKGLVKL